MKKKAILAIALSATVISACGVNNRDNTLHNRGVNEPTRVTNPANNNTLFDNTGNRFNNDRYRNNATNFNNNNHTVTEDNTRNTSSRMRVADRAVRKIVSLPEVTDANVIVTDNNAYVAARLNDNRDLSRDIERKIADQVKAADRDINDVYVSVNPDFYDRMTNYSNDIRSGRPITGFFDEFTETVRRIFPTHINR